MEWLGGGVLGSWGQRGKNWDNHNSLINKIKFFKKRMVAGRNVEDELESHENWSQENDG